MGYDDVTTEDMMTSSMVRLDTFTPSRRRKKKICRIPIWVGKLKAAVLCYHYSLLGTVLAY